MKQIDQALRFFAAFLDGVTGALRRVYHLDAFLGIGARVSMTLDASPWGIGAVLSVDGELQEWIADALTTDDEDVLGHQIGTAEGQQTWESLAVLVAMRAWAHDWRRTRAVLEIRADSIASLTMTLHMKASGRGPGIVARELALCLGEAEFRPDVGCHVPGVANVTADTLSRRFQPGKAWSLPGCLQGKPETVVGIRNRKWYRTLS